jgi:hypothetical protein
MLKVLVVVLLIFATSARADLDLETWDRLLGEAVDEGFVDYTLWRDNPEFDALVQQIAAADTGVMSREQQLVFYINAYNILAAQGILDGGSPKSLLGRYGYFKRDKYEVAGQSINLYSLEHDFILPLEEPRIHFAIVCASASCPVLRSEAYVPGKLDEQLDDAARGFINDTQRNQFDLHKGVARISKIFDWFEEDFEVDGRSLQQYLAPYVTDPDVAAALEQNALRVKHLKYDWNLNGRK